ncbi:hypothetical protein LCGC14_0578810 [marine sediment metagenome]|uniref:RNase NYN domain-containing protein n=1 Tax=marine sediment metagenome TaxID=412755 RepID=A0A0F9RM39_9ZZZZ
MVENIKMVADISNIAFFNKRNDKPKLEYIDLLFASLSRKIETIGIADCALYHQIDNKKLYKSKYLVPKIIYEAPAKIEADDFILSYAKENNALILSNDRFKQYNIVSKEWLKEYHIRFMIIKNQFYFEQRFVNLVGEVFSENPYDLNSIFRERQRIEG